MTDSRWNSTSAVRGLYEPSFPPLPLSSRYVGQINARFRHGFASADVLPKPSFGVRLLLLISRAPGLMITLMRRLTFLKPPCPSSDPLLYANNQIPANAMATRNTHVSNCLSSPNELPFFYGFAGII